MKTIAISIICFIAGLALAGYIGLKFFVYGGQIVSTAEIQIYSHTLKMIESNDIESIKNRACLVLPIAIEQKAEWDNSFFANDFFHGWEEKGKDLEELSRKHLSEGGICNPA
ncbi:hypothetical protein [Shewanella atlantica]|uniref:hypothetical protein n=1 Tax=Shewanella atlantica TaxID=271099 RepID=UPI003736F6C2